MRTRIASAIAIVLLAGILACGKDSGDPVSPPPPAEHRKVVQIQDNVFSPKGPGR
jgi:hypothetical protein